MSYGNLMGEVAALREARNYGILEAIQFIMANKVESRALRSCSEEQTYG